MVAFVNELLLLLSSEHGRYRFFKESVRRQRGSSDCDDERHGQHACEQSGGEGHVEGQLREQVELERQRRGDHQA